MHTEYHKWWSPSLNQDMEMKVYGHAGKPVIAFPTSSGRFFDYENFGMVDACRPWIDTGQIMLFAVDSVDAQSWDNLKVTPAERNKRHLEYDQHILTEVVPLAQSYGLTSRAFVSTGCSAGAYHAANFFFRHPDVFDAVISLSGLFRLDRPQFHLTGQDLADVYFNSPLSYLPDLNDPWYTDRYRKSQIIVCCGQGAWEGPPIEDALALRTLLESKGIPCWVDLWGTDVVHDWPWWKKQIAYFLGRMRLV